MEKNYIKGHFNKYIFKSNNGYVIGLLKVEETTEEEIKNYKTITFTGYFAELTEDDIYIFYGELVNHPKYGIQYKVDEYERVKPEDKDGIVEFLSSDLFKGVGKKLATAIVETLGVTALDNILENKDNLLLVPKITNKMADNIYNTLLNYEESHKTIVYLTELGFNMKDSMIIYNRYKSNTIFQIEHNIYDIIYPDENITFPKIDHIARKLNISIYDERRIISGLYYVIQKLIFQSGDTYLFFEEIFSSAIRELNIYVEEEKIKLYLDELRFEGKIILEDNQYYIKEVYESEQSILKKVKLLQELPPIKNKKINNYIKELEKEYEIEYNDDQITAITSAIENHLLIITGGPGTGKTTIIKAIVEIYKKINKYNNEEMINSLALLAATGRASKRMSEATLYPATTIHRFLKWNKESNKFMVDEFHPDNSDIVIVDEVSMIDVNLLASLLNGTKNNIQLILVGDYHQLPSIGPGQILKDMIESKVINTINLNQLYRQSEDSYIPILAEEIKNNSISENYLITKNDYTFLTCNGDMILSNLKNLCNKLVDKGYDYKRVQVMAPMYAGINGIDNLNKELQEIFNPVSELKKEYHYGDIVFRENDKILQLVNMPEENVFNGDIGLIRYILDESETESKKVEIYVDYDGMIVKYLPKDLNKIKHGFAISIHKSQGSEFDFVIFPICYQYSRMLYQKLIYTGVTRAKKKLILIGEPPAFLRGIQNQNEVIKKTNLKNKLEKMYN